MTSPNHVIRLSATSSSSDKIALPFHLLDALNTPLQSVPQDQKSVTFSNSVISLNQLLQNSKNTAYIFLTFRNHVKIILSQNILQNILNVVYRTTLSIRTERTDKQ